MSIALPKILFSCILAVSILAGTVVAQSDTKSVEELQRLNKQVVAEYQAFKFDDALKTADSSLKLAISLFGENSLEAALSYEYLGEIYLAQEKSGLATTNLQTAWSIHQKNSFRNISRAGRVLTQLVPAMIANKKESELKEMLSQIINAADSGDQISVTLLPFALSALTKLYTHTRQVELADETYVRRYALFTSLNNQNLKDFISLWQEHACHESSIHSSKLIERRKRFKTAVKNQIGDDLIFDGVFYTPRKSEITEGKAQRLSPPEYPPAAKAVRASGTVAVKVLIDEKGNVRATDALCGHPLLRRSAEEAAKKAKFSPTLMAGKAVRVYGFVTYNFVP